jgi:hypothetical protein
MGFEREYLDGIEHKTALKNLLRIHLRSIGVKNDFTVSVRYNLIRIRCSKQDYAIVKKLFEKIRGWVI